MLPITPETTQLTSHGSPLQASKHNLASPYTMILWGCSLAARYRAQTIAEASACKAKELLNIMPCACSNDSKDKSLS